LYNQSSENYGQNGPKEDVEDKQIQQGVASPTAP